MCRECVVRLVSITKQFGRVSFRVWALLVRGYIVRGRTTAHPATPRSTTDRPGMPTVDISSSARYNIIIRPCVAEQLERDATLRL